MRADENSMSDLHRNHPTDDEGKEFARRLREIMGAAVLSVADQAGVELAVAIAQRLDAGEWQLRTTVGLDGDRQPDLSMLRFHILVEADNGLVELCSAKWTALGAPEESARERSPSRAARTATAYPTTCRDWTRLPDREAYGPPGAGWPPRRGSTL